MDLQVLSLLKYACDTPTEVSHWWHLWSSKLGFGELCVFYLGLCSPDLKGNKFSLFTYHWQSYNILTKWRMPRKTTLFNSMQAEKSSGRLSLHFHLVSSALFHQFTYSLLAYHSAVQNVEYDDKPFHHKFSRWFPSSGFEWKPISLVSNEICPGNSWGNWKETPKITRMRVATVFFTAS